MGVGEIGVGEMELTQVHISERTSHMIEISSINKCKKVVPIPPLPLTATPEFICTYVTFSMLTLEKCR